MEKKEYDFANLSQSELEQVHNLEKQFSEKNGEEVILIAYDKNNQ